MSDKDKISRIKWQRDRYFMAVDRISPARWEAFTEQEKQEVRDFRTALLDITKQADYPDIVIWPTKPHWL